MLESDPKTGVKISFDKGFYKELRRILFKSSMSVNEFFSFIAQQMVIGDPRVYELLEEAKKSRAKKEIKEIVHSDEESLYALIEEGLNKNKKE